MLLFGQGPQYRQALDHRHVHQCDMGGVGCEQVTGAVETVRGADDYELGPFGKSLREAFAIQPDVRDDGDARGIRGVGVLGHGHR